MWYYISKNTHGVWFYKLGVLVFFDMMWSCGMGFVSELRVPIIMGEIGGEMGAYVVFGV